MQFIYMSLSVAIGVLLKIQPQSPLGGIENEKSNRFNQAHITHNIALNRVAMAHLLCLCL